MPYNIAQYALLLMMIAQVTDMEPFELIVSTGDSHLYFDQLEMAKQQLERTPYKLPTMVLNPDIKNIGDFKMTDFHLVNYIHHEKINYPVAM